MFDIAANMPSVIFLALLLMVALAIIGWLTYLGDAHRFYAVYDIIRSWCGMIAVLLMVFLLGKPALMVLGVAVGVQAFREWCDVVQHDFRSLIGHPYERLIKPFMKLLIVIFTVSFIWLSYVLPTENLSILLWLIFTAQINDICQYLMGKKFAHRYFDSKLAPKISPQKTIEGFLLGILLMLFMAIGVGQLLTPFSWLVSFIMALLIGLLGVIGDLTESLFKRCYGVKDTANWLKGHGGLLDRIDSLLYNVPIFLMLYMVLLS